MQEKLLSVIPGIVDRHFEEAAFLWRLRQRGSVAPDWLLADLMDLDERLEAHVDGLRGAGAYGWRASEDALDRGAGEVFVAGLLAIESRERERMARVIRVSVGSPESQLAV